MSDEDDKYRAGEHSVKSGCLRIIAWFCSITLVLGFLVYGICFMRWT
jgi:hypothetical protein